MYDTATTILLGLCKEVTLFVLYLPALVCIRWPALGNN